MDFTKHSALDYLRPICVAYAGETAQSWRRECERI